MKGRKEKRSLADPARSFHEIQDVVERFVLEGRKGKEKMGRGKENWFLIDAIRTFTE